MWKIAKEYTHHLLKLNLEKGMFTFEKLQQFGYFKILKVSSDRIFQVRATQPGQTIDKITEVLVEKNNAQLPIIAKQLYWETFVYSIFPTTGESEEFYNLKIHQEWVKTNPLQRELWQ